MDQETTCEVWRILEDNIGRLERATALDGELVRHTQVALGMLLECDPDQVLQCVRDSDLPTRALVSWLAYEGGRLGLDDGASALVRHWTGQGAGTDRLIPPPQLVMV